jgi:hypothetical protein
MTGAADPGEDSTEFSAVRDAEIVGCVGRVIVDTRGAAGPGEILVGVRGGREAYLAWSAEPMKCGEQVLVIGIRSARTVDVVAWAEDFSARR